MGEWKWIIFLATVIAFLWKIWAVYFENERLKKRLFDLETKNDRRDREDAREKVYDDDLESVVKQSNARFGAGNNPE